MSAAPILHVMNFPVPDWLKSKLTRSGIDNLNDLKGLLPTDLIRGSFSSLLFTYIYFSSHFFLSSQLHIDYGLTKNEVHDLYEALKLFRREKPTSVYDLIRADDGKAITTLSHNFDRILGGGVQLGQLTEICGEAGVGKTQLCMQLCVSVQMSSHLDGMEGQAVYIDTEGSFMPKRVVEITNATCRSLEKLEINADLKKGTFIHCILR